MIVHYRGIRFNATAARVKRPGEPTDVGSLFRPPAIFNIDKVYCINSRRYLIAVRVSPRVPGCEIATRADISSLDLRRGIK